MADENLYRDVLEAALDFDSRGFWKDCSNLQYFAVKVPNAGEPIFGVVTGQVGPPLGLSLIKGPGALSHLLKLISESGPGDDDFEDMDYLAVNMEYFDSLAPEQRAFYRKARHPVTSTTRVPLFLAKPPQRQPHPPNDEELEQFLYVFRGILEADHQAEFRPSDAAPSEGVLTLDVTGGIESPSVTIEVIPYDAPEAPSTIPVPAASLDAEKLEGLKPLDATWLVGLPYLPVVMDEDDDRSVRLLIVADEASELVIHGEMLASDEIDKAAKMLPDILQGKNAMKIKGLPERILFTSRKLHDAAAPALIAAGADCSYVPEIPLLEELRAEFLEDLAGQMGDGADPSLVPAPDDLAGWKAADKRLLARFTAYLDSDDLLWASRAAKRYFRDDDLEYFFDEYGPHGAFQAYLEWGIVSYRPGKKSKTQAEQMLAGDLPEAQKLLLRARMESHPSLYRIVSHDPSAGTITLEDALLGGEVTIHDLLMSQNIEDGLFAPARVFPAGNFLLHMPAGPLLPQGMGMAAADFLQKNGVELTAEGLRRDAHKFGWLWDWLEQVQANRTMPRLRNSDGDDLLWHTASFGIADEEDVRAVLGKREDIDYDEEAGQFVWFRELHDDDNFAGGRLTLGRIELVGEELVLTVNSAAWLAAARDWLDKIPGLSFQGVTTQEWDQQPQERPTGKRASPLGPEEITPEIAEAVRDALMQQYMSWADKPLPALGGKTPRQTCQSPDGRRKVAAMIRTIVTPSGPVPIEVPREAMLRQLGLATTAPEAAPDPPRAKPTSGQIAPRTKVRRNDPCPCGSGKKYKKCCGR